MGNFTYRILFILILITGVIYFPFTSYAQSFSHPSAGLVVPGDLMHAAGGDDFIGVVYSRTGSVYYNQLNSAGTWEGEVLLGPGSQGRIAIDDAGNVHVVFNSNGLILYLKFDGTEWTTPVTIESLNTGGAGVCSKPDISVDAVGGVHVTYTDSHGTSDDIRYDDIMYAVKTSDAFTRQVIFTGYRSYSSSGTWDANYYNKGSYIAVNEGGDYFIMSHCHSIYAWYADRDVNYYIKISSNLGSGSINNYNSDIFTIHDLEYDGTTVRALYKQTTHKVSDLTLSGTTISFSNSVDIPASSVSALGSDGLNLVVGGMNGTSLFTKYNYLDQTYLNVGAKNNLSAVVKAGGVFYVLYTGNSDGMIKIKEVALPLSFIHFEVPGQSEPSYINGQSGTIEIKVDGGTDLTNLIASYQTTSDVTGVSVNSVSQASGVTTNDFSDPVTYTLTDGTDSQNWLADISVGILDTVYASICEGDSLSFGTGEYTLEGEYTETFTASDGSDSTVMLILTVIENSSGTITEEACGSYTAPDGTVYYTSGTKTAVIPNAAGCDSVITINLTVHPIYNSQLPASDNLVAYYSFNGNANDLSGNQYDGVVNGATLVSDRFGNPDGAYSFDGRDDYIDLGDWENGGSMTFNFWAKWEAWHNWSRLMDFGLGQSNKNIYIGNQSTSNNLSFHIMEGTTALHEFNCPGILELNTWVMITCTVDETGLMKAYKNGELAGTFQGTTPDIITRTRQYFGRSNWSADQYFQGVIDEVMLYDVVLTEGEIRGLYQQTQNFIAPVYATVCENDLPYEWNGNQYAESGEYVVTLSTIHGCDSIVTLKLDVLPVYRDTVDYSSCANELPYTWQGSDYTETGIYSDTLTSVFGCDSILTLNFEVLPVYRDTVDYSACANELPYTWQGLDLTETGIYSDTLASLFGCDSILTLNFEILPVHRDTVDYSACANELPYSWQSLSLSAPGIYSDTLISAMGCDSILTIDFDVLPVYRDTVDYSACANELPYIWQGLDLTETGIYSDTLTSVLGCDSIFTLNFEVLPVYRDTVDYSACADELPYIWQGMDLTEPGIYSDTLTSVFACDSILTLNFEVLPVYRDTVDYSACANELPYSWQSLSLSAPGIYSDTLTSDMGCDSILTIDFDVLPVYRDTVEYSACANELPYTWQGMDLTETGFYSNTLESVMTCDSILTLNFIVYPLFDVFDTVSVPELDLPYKFGSEWLTGGGTYIDTFATVNGCDSIVTLTLVVDSTDNIPPEIVCVKTTLELDENGEAVLNVDDVYNFVYDAGGIKSVIAYETDFNCSDIGQQSVRVEATDNYGNSSYCTSLVTIIDNLPPVINSVDDVTVTPEGDDCFTTIDYPDIIADDNCGVNDLYLLEGFGPDGQFPVGTTMEIWVAEDASGNRDTMSFNVNVEGDISAPGFDAIEDIEIMEDAGWTATDISNIADGSFCLDYQLDFVLAGFDNELIAEYEVEYVTGDDTAILKLLPATDAYGESQAVLTVSINETGREFSDTFNIRIIPVNDPPFIIQPFSSIEMRPGDSLSVSVNSGEGLVFGDVDDDILQLSLRMLNGETLPDWLAYRNDSLFAFPSAADTGCVELVFEITDAEGGMASSRFDICVGPYLGVNDPVSREIRVYPNPTSGKVYVDFSGFNGVLKDVSVVNIAGQEVVRRRLTDQIRQEVDLSHLTSGIYILKVTGDDINKDFKIILKTQ